MLYVRAQAAALGVEATPRDPLAPEYDATCVPVAEQDEVAGNEMEAFKQATLGLDYTPGVRTKGGG